MRLIDKDHIVYTVYADDRHEAIVTKNEIESMIEVEAIPIDYLLKECTEAVFKREMSGDSMKAIHHIIAKWREENENN